MVSYKRFLRKEKKKLRIFPGNRGCFHNNFISFHKAYALPTVLGMAAKLKQSNKIIHKKTIPRQKVQKVQH